MPIAAPAYKFFYAGHTLQGESQLLLLDQGGVVAIFALPIGQLLLVVLAAIIFLGVAQRVLDRMRLTDTQALIILGALFISPLFPNVTVAPGISINLAGTLIPLGVIAYLIITADEAYERTRAVTATIITAAAVFALEQILPPEPTQAMVLDVDPLWAAGLLAGLVGYLSGRSRRSSFIAGAGGIVLADIVGVIVATAGGAQGTFAAIGGAGAFDAIIIAGVIAVVLAEVVGETREYFARRRGRPGVGAKARDSMPSSTSTLGSLVFGVGVAAVLLVGSNSLSKQLYGELPEPHLSSSLYRIFDEDGKLVNETSWAPAVGDTWIDEANLLYEVIRVDGRLAVARAKQKVQLTRLENEQAVPVQAPGLLGRLRRSLGLGPKEPEKTILIIHTHNAESYVPSDGKAMIAGKGGIHKVGAILAEELEKRGFNVIHDESLHLPHDRGAYRRSRRTILANFSRQPAAVLDIHRDAIPDPEFYADEVNGQGITRLRIVVGRQNPNRSQTLQFAKDLKAVADEVHPGFVKQIYDAKNNYNQDLGPRVILFEVGTHTNARESAERAMKILAEVIERYFAQISE